MPALMTASASQRVIMAALTVTGTLTPPHMTTTTVSASSPQPMATTMLGRRGPSPSVSLFLLSSPSLVATLMFTTSIIKTDTAAAAAAMKLHWHKDDYDPDEVGGLAKEEEVDEDWDKDEYDPNTWVVDMLIRMGITDDRDRVERALRKAHDRATELSMMSGGDGIAIIQQMVVGGGGGGGLQVIEKMMSGGNLRDLLSQAGPYEGEDEEEEWDEDDEDLGDGEDSDPEHLGRNEMSGFGGGQAPKFEDFFTAFLLSILVPMESFVHQLQGVEGHYLYGLAAVYVILVAALLWCIYTVTIELWGEMRKQYRRRHSSQQEQGGNLAKAATQEEWDKIKALPLGGDDYWLGATDDVKEGQWRWVSDNSLVGGDFNPDSGFNYACFSKYPAYDMEGCDGGKGEGQVLCEFCPKEWTLEPTEKIE